MKSHSKKRPQINPRTLKKASRVRAQRAQSVGVPGPRTPSKNGYRVTGTTCSDYETFFEHFEEGQTSDRWIHATKTRTYRGLNGQGFILLRKGGAAKSVVLVAGTEVTIEPGISFSLVTLKNKILDVLVSQSAGYEADLETLEESDTTADMSRSQLEAVSSADHVVNSVALPPQRRGRSKAREQQLALATARGKQTGVSAAPTQALALDKTTSVNVRPSHGRDLPGEPG